jgi:multicomponent K+:H+ antiporter subunit A
MLWLVTAALLAAVLPLWARGLPIGDRTQLPLSPAFALIWLLGALCAMGAAWKAKYHRLAALALLGGAGLCVCLTFLWFSAPDLALTQIVVEVVTTILILLGLRWLPRRDETLRKPTLAEERRTQLRRYRDMALALTTGAGMALLSFAMMSRPFPDSTSTFFLENALTGGGGANGPMAGGGARARRLRGRSGTRAHRHLPGRGGAGGGCDCGGGGCGGWPAARRRCGHPGLPLLLQRHR